MPENGSCGFRFLIEFFYPHSAQFLLNPGVKSIYIYLTDFRCDLGISEPCHVWQRDSFPNAWHFSLKPRLPVRREYKAGGYRHAK